MNDSFKPKDLLLSILKKWWVISIGMIVGGLIAFVLSGFIPPIYESSASFSVTIDYTKTGALSDVQEDQAMRGIGYVIESDELIEMVIHDVQAMRPTFSKDQFLSESTLDREEFLWTIRYRSGDPIFAKEVARIWAQKSSVLIQEGLEHALIVDSETKILWGLEECMQRITSQDGVETLCGYSSINELIDAIDELSGLIQEEKTMAKGLFSPLAVQMVIQPQISTSPVRYQKNVLVSSGILCGFLVSFLFQGIVSKRSHDLDK